MNDQSGKPSDRKRAENTLAGLVHDIKHPLSLIPYYLDKVVENSKLSEQDPDLAKIRALLQNALLLVENGLASSKILEDRFAIKKTAENPNQMLKEIISFYRPKFDQNQISVKCSYAEEIKDLALDPAYFPRVLQNLIDNALKFTPKNGNIAVSVSRTDGYVIFKIEDSGSGIKPDDLEAIFEPYANPDIEHPERGSGIGLFVVRSITEAHAGRVEVEQSSLGGACFSIWIPAEERSAD